jgi:hypothetical protein
MFEIRSEIHSYIEIKVKRKDVPVTGREGP